MCWYSYCSCNTLKKLWKIAVHCRHWISNVHQCLRLICLILDTMGRVETRNPAPPSHFKKRLSKTSQNRAKAVKSAQDKQRKCWMFPQETVYRSCPYPPMFPYPCFLGFGKSRFCGPTSQQLESERTQGLQQFKARLLRVSLFLAFYTPHTWSHMWVYLGL